MFVLYAVALGLVVGFVLGGRPAGLGSLSIRWSWLILATMLVQVVLFSAPVTERIGDLGPPIYVASTAVVLVAVLANWRIPGIAIVALGAASNLAAIVANGGFMPAGVGAMAALGRVEEAVYSNSALLAHPALEPLTDIFYIPRGIPFSNVFSIGDVVIGIGVALAIASAMRSARSAPARRAS
jgi:hypothetical protein